MKRTSEQIRERAFRILGAAESRLRVRLDSVDWQIGILAEHGKPPTQKLDRLRKALRAAACKGEEIRLCSGYSEPVYDDPECGLIAFGDWNIQTVWVGEKKSHEDVDDTLKRVGVLFDRLGIPCEWSDEWTECDDCNRAVRASGNSYSWTRNYVEVNGEIVCEECIAKHPECYLEEIEGDAARAITFDSIDLAEHGYVRLDFDGETGFHPGQDDDPELVAKELRSQGIERFVFKVDSVGQFNTDWSVWVHRDELGKFDPDAFDSVSKQGESNSQGLKRALEAASAQSAALKADQAVHGGVIYSRLDVGSGTASTRLARPEEFVEGIRD